MVDEIKNPSIDPEIQHLFTLVSEEVFPPAFPGWHAQILISLQNCHTTLTLFDAGIQSLLTPEMRWVESLGSLQTAPPSHLSARQMRAELASKRILGHHYLVDAILAEVVVGKVLNEALFSQLKAITVFACLALMFLKGDNAIEKDATIDEALRSVRLMASTERRQVVATALSQINFIQPIGSLLKEIKAQREQFKNIKSVSIHSIAIEAVLQRLYQARQKQERHVSRESRTPLQYSVVASAVEAVDEHNELLLLRDVSRRRGRVKRLPWEEEEEQSLVAQTQTLLVSNRHHDLMDLEVRRWQSQSVAAVMSMRNLLLPCSAWLATHEQVRRLVAALLKQFCGLDNPAAGWNLLQLVMGMSDESIRALPIWRTTKLVMPKQGLRRESLDGQDQNRDGLWLVSSCVWLQRYIEVSQSRVHKKLRSLLPSVDLFLMLPLPGEMLTLFSRTTGRAIERAALMQSLAEANHSAGTDITLRQLKKYMQVWLVRQGVDSAVVGILRAQTAQQCSPIAYSHLDIKPILTVWTGYLSALGLPVNLGGGASAGSAVGSALYPRQHEIKALLSKFQSVVRTDCLKRPRKLNDFIHVHNFRVRHCLLIMHLSTAARPVTEMYGRRADYCLTSRFILLEDKEGRSVSSARLVPLGVRAVAQLQVWETYLHSVAASRIEGFSHLAEAAKQALDSSGPLFFWAEPSLESPSTVEAVSITPSNMQEKFDSLFPLAPNWHRHAVRSHLAAQQAPAYLIDALMGHEEMGGEFCHQYSHAALSELFVLSDILDRWHESLQLEIFDGWSIR